MAFNQITANDPESKSLDFLEHNMTQLSELFPELLTEGPYGVSVNVDVLKQLVGDKTITDSEEKYGLNWHGKRAARRLALTPSTGTLRPCPEDSLDWDTTQNLMIEGDNLEVLKLLQKSYAGKVKLIYIDPPYNTGGDFVYKDDFRDNIRNYKKLVGLIDESGDKASSLAKNSDSSGRFHTNWLNMIYPRLKLAKDLLKQDGLIFISIDDGEVASLKLILNEIFGEENFEGHIHWRRRHNQPNDPTKMLALVTEHVLVYSKDKAAYKASGVGKIALTGDFSNPDNDPRGDWASKPWKVGSDQSGSRYKLTTPTGVVYDEEWMGEEATYLSLLKDNRIIFPNNGNGFPRKKYFRYEREEEGQCATNWWSHDQFGHNQGANNLLEKIFGVKNVFSNPKPVELIDGILSVGNVKDNDIVLDFFAGSGTTAHAVMLKNSQDLKNRRFILVQLPEILDIENKDQKIAAVYCDKISKPRNIAELTKERLRRSSKMIQNENPTFSGDLGFRTFKLDSSNIKLWEFDRNNLPKTLEEYIENVKSYRTNKDILFELILKFGLDLNVSIEEKQISQKTVISIGKGIVFVCLDNQITRPDVEQLTSGIIQWFKELSPVLEPTCIFLDNAFEDDVTKSNLVAILNQHSIHNIRSL